jgi:5-methyltetrahydrofolate--homocysteine methyltransferase
LEELSNIIDAVVAGDIGKTKSAVCWALDTGIPAMRIINDGLVSGLQVVGERFSTGDMFLPEMMMSAIAAKAGIEDAAAVMKTGEYKAKATIVMGTVKGDVHDIGKNLVELILRCRGFEVVDLGVDVSEEEFVNAVRYNKPNFLGMSCLLTTTMVNMKYVIAALTEAGLRDTVKVAVGGCPVNQEFASQIGADGYARDAGSAVTMLEGLLTKTIRTT